MNTKIGWALGLSLLVNIASAADNTPIRLGVMASGTLAWELAAMKNEQLLDNAGFTLQTVDIATQQAGKVALQSDSVDLIVSDWIWTSSMRAEGHDYSFYPYSDASGGLLVPGDSPIKSIADLKGKKLGIAGGELDKNWLLLQALGRQQGIDLNASVEKVYGAPPLLNQQLGSQRLDALLTYWQFAASLEVQGYRQLLTGADLIQQLGITDKVPSLGYVFRQGWGEQHKAALQAFLKTAQTAKDRLCTEESTWEKITPLTGSTDPATQQQLRARYCAGRVQQWGEKEQQAAEKIYQVLHQLGDNKLTGKAEHIQPGTFWPAP